MHLIAPSILAADFGNLDRDIRMINRSRAELIHCDVMDGLFVPNISFGIPVLEAVKRVAEKPMDVHLMIEKPERYLEAFQKAGAQYLSVHAEACIHLDRTLHAIRELGMKPGIALNPGTPVESLRDVIHLADLVCVMSVNPGFGGQKFIQNTYDKVRRLRQLIHERDSAALIEIDGGVTSANAAELLRAGADVLVAGSFVFSAADPEGTIAGLKDIHV